MSYSNDYIERIQFPSANIGGAGQTALQFSGPKGLTGRILDFGIMPVSIAFTAVTTAARLQVGALGGSATAYADMPLGTAGIGTEVRATDQAVDPLKNVVIPADTIATLTGVAATGGTPAGTGVPFVTVLWY